MCSDPSLLACMTPQLLGLFCAGIIGIAAAIACVSCRFLFLRELSTEDRYLCASWRALRTRLGIRMCDGFLLSSERLPLWISQASFTVLVAEQFEAAVHFDCLRDDFDPKLLDALCMVLRGTGEQCAARVDDWILSICCFLLEPAQLSQARLRTRKDSGVSWVSAAFSGQAGDQTSVERAPHNCRSQEERYAFFISRVAGLEVLRADNNKLFKRIQGMVDELMVQVTVTVFFMCIFAIDRSHPFSFSSIADSQLLLKFHASCYLYL